MDISGYSEVKKESRSKPGVFYYANEAWAAGTAGHGFVH